LGASLKRTPRSADEVIVIDGGAAGNQGMISDVNPVLESPGCGAARFKTRRPGGCTMACRLRFAAVLVPRNDMVRP
jgi:hypothetical protein